MAALNSEELRDLVGVEMLRRMWLQQYSTEVNEDGQSQLQVRADDNQPAGKNRLHSPYDQDARFSAKREMSWVGYKTHLTETCDKDDVHLITLVTTTLATQADMTTLDTVHHCLAQKDLLPNEHLVDAGYADAESLVSAKKDYGLELYTPVRDKVS